MTVNRNLIAVAPWLLVLVTTTALVAGGKPDAPAGRLTREQARILSYMSIVCLDDGFGNEIETIRITGVNVQVVNGTGTTNSTNSGGNIIVGYNSYVGQLDSPQRTGSHNLVIGDLHTFTSYSGIVSGWRNTISAPGASVTGGTDNVASGWHSSISGGNQNDATGGTASISGGEHGLASGSNASITGGHSNTATGGHSVVSGGFERTTDGLWDWAAGGLSEDE